MIDWAALISDETGKASTARCAFWLTLIITLIVVVLSSAGAMTTSSAAYSLLGTVVLALAAWAGGPRAMKYLGPQIGKVASAIGKAKGDERLPDIRTDDERGD